jgi:Protein of unknown function (DUF1217)
MSFAPILPLSGFTGWGFLKRTMARQLAVQQALPAQQRDEAYFRDRIGKADTAEKLVNDKRLLRIALTAFGLEGDVNSKAFIQKILEGGTLKEGSLANKLADKQYTKFAAAFGYGDFSVPRTKISTFPDEILEQYRSRSFETAVGLQNNTYRLAMNAEREIPTLAGKAISETAKWFTLLGNAPMREVMQTALGLPRSFSSIDIDQQVGVLRTKTEAIFGSTDLGQFKDPAKMEALTRRFLLQSDIQSQASASSPGAIALALLRSQA